MKKRLIITSAPSIVAVGVLFYAAPFQGTPRPLAAIFPGGPLAYLEAKDFQAELRDWNGSAVQQRWLASARYAAFSRSNLYLRLHDAWGQFSAAAGFVPDSALVQSLAGRESALAIYDIGNLAFLYVSRLPASQAMHTVLWQTRTKYDQRKAGRFDFFVRAESGRTVAFAVADDYLVLGTREETVAAALRLLSGEPLSSLESEAWYKQAVAAAGTPGELRLVTNLEDLVKSVQFRSYWIQRNASEIRNYVAAVSDIRRSHDEIREDRVLVRKTPMQPVTGSAEALLQLAPDDAAFCRSWVNPSVGEVSSWIERKLLAPKVDGQPRYDYAPPAESPDAAPGSESDLEMRIDEPPMAAQSSISLEDLSRVLGAARLTSVLVTEGIQPLADGVFTATPSTVAVEASKPWDGSAMRTALTTAAATLWTTSASGVSWIEHKHGAHTVYALSGLAPLYMTTEGALLFVANSENVLDRMLDRVGARAVPSASNSIALFRHDASRDGFHSVMSLLDHAQPASSALFGGQDARPPRFFSEDLWSLSEVFSRISDVSMRTEDQGWGVREVLTYVLR